MSQPETRFKQRVLKDLKTLPDTWVLKTHERARRGVLDLVICLRGKFVSIELKVDGERPDPLQASTIQKVIRSNGIAFYTTPRVWPDHFRMLQDLLGLRGPTGFN